MKKILIVDDDKIYLTTLELHLNRMGLDVEKAENGEKAFLLFQKNPTDIVIADLQMPKLDGITLLKLVKNFRPMTEFILLTGHGTIDICVEAMKNGAHNFLVKPIDYDKLKSLVENCMDIIEINKKQPLASDYIDSEVNGEENRSVTNSGSIFDPIKVMKEYDLTKRETEIVEQILAGKSDKEIGELLYISHHTVKKHVHNLLSKFTVSNRRELIVRFK